jgi:multicomponent Na+:H+ antiporter subunit G
MGEVLALTGSVFVLLAAVGVVRFDDILARMHALAKASTFGVLLMLAGAIVALHDTNDVTSVALAALCQVLTSPPASNMLSRATYLARAGASASEERNPDAPSPSA